MELKYYFKKKCLLQSLLGGYYYFFLKPFFPEKLTSSIDSNIHWIIPIIIFCLVYFFVIIFKDIKIKISEKIF